MERKLVTSHPKLMWLVVEVRRVCRRQCSTTPI